MKYNKFNNRNSIVNRYIKESDSFDDDEFLVEDDNVSEGDESGSEVESEVDEETIRIDSLKIAMKIAKMLDNVKIEDCIELSGLVENFLKNYVPGADIEVVLGLKDSEDDESNEGEEDLEGGDDDMLSLEDIDSEDAEEESGNDKESDSKESDSEDFTIDDEDYDNDEKAANEGGSEIPDEFII